LLQYEIKPNLKTLGPRLGEGLKDVQKALAALDPASVVEEVQADGNLVVAAGGEAVVLSQADLLINTKAPDGWAGLADQRTQIALDVRVTEELAREGIAREIVRHIQELRKTSGLEIEDRIHLYLQTDSSTVRRAIETHESYIRGETLTTALTNQPLDGGAHKSVIKLQGQTLTIELDKAAPAQLE
jgi:isoleucyl-tRNA synthetase